MNKNLRFLHSITRWSLHFMADQIASGQRFRVFNVVGDFTRECLVMHLGTSITGYDVVQVLEAAIGFRGAPQAITTDTGPEFVGKAFDRGISVPDIFELRLCWTGNF